MATLDITESKTLLEFLLDLLNNHDALAEFRDDPHAALQHAGLGDCTVDDIKELLPVVLEKVDAEKCAQYEDDCDDDKCYDSEPKHDDHHEHHHKPVDCDDEGRPAPHCSPTDQVVAHLNYVTNHYSYDSHDTYNITNNNTDIWADHGSNVEVTNETHNVGANAVSIEGDNNAPFATGGHNVIGDGNAVSGDGSTTAFGSGPAVSAHSIDGGDHSGIVFGSGAVSTVDASTDSHEDNSLTNSQNDNSHGSHNPITDSQNHITDNSDTDNSTDNSVNTDASLHDSANTDASTNDSGNTHLDLVHH